MPIKTTAEAYEASAIPRKIEVHTTPQSHSESEDLPEDVTRRPVEQKSPAEWAYERLILYIQNFEKQLDGEQEVAMGFAGDASGVLRIEGMGFFDPDIVTFYGSDSNGARTQLIQHVTQLSVMLRALPKEPEQAVARRIGFKLADSLKTS